MIRFDSNLFFKQRFRHHIKILSRYLKYIFNGHIAFALFFFLAAMSVFYQQWLETMPDNFPSSLIISIVLALLAIYQPIQTFLVEADLVFLIRVEKKMRSYFMKSLLYSYAIQSYLIFISFAAMGPLYFTSFPDQTIMNYLLLMFIVFIFKLSSLFINWWKLHDTSRRFFRWETVIRFVYGLIIFVNLINGKLMISILFTLLWTSLFLYIYHLYSQNSTVLWEKLLEEDQRRMQSFYKLANLFTEVPSIKTTIKKRNLLTNIVSKFKFTKEGSYRYLYTLTFIRNNDYFKMFIRLTLIGSLCILFISSEWLQWLIALLVIYMTNLQLLYLYNEHRFNIWLRLYPFRLENTKVATQQILLIASFIQLFVFVLVLLYVQAFFTIILTIVSSILSVLYLLFIYFPKRVVKD